MAARLFSVLALVLSSACAALAQTGAPTPPEQLTVAEKSDFKATARYDEVLSLLDTLAKASPKARRLDMGKTGEGRVIPVLTLADPPVSNAREARAQADAGKLVVLMIGNIHAGEVDGKEGLPILAREIISQPDHPLLKNMVLVFAPIFNCDGNERVSKDNRPGQHGPDEGMGIRENAAGLDLNRDFVKLESPEVRALVKFISDWDPAIFVDTHTTNGSYHQYAVTYEGPRHPAGDQALIEYVRDTMFPAVSKDLEAKAGLKTFYYGDFNKEHTRWDSFPLHPRFTTNYVGLRGRISILSEGYSYSSYKERVLGTRDFVRTCLEFASTNKDHIRKLLADADRRTIDLGRNPPKDPKPEQQLAVRSKAAKAPETMKAAGFVEEVRDGKTVSTGEKKDYDVEVWNRGEADMLVPRAYAYIIPQPLVSGLARAVETLQRHGIEVEELREDIELDIEACKVTQMARSPQEFQKHNTARVDAERHAESRMIPAGSIVVRTGQKLGHLASILLEPASDDGLVTWNFFDDTLALGQDFPVLRVPAATHLHTTAIRPLRDESFVQESLSYKRVFESDRGVNLGGNPTGGGAWIDDETWRVNRNGGWFKVNAKTGRAEKLTFDNEAIVKALATLPSIGEKGAGELARTPFLRTDAGRTGALFERDNDLYYARLDGSLALRLTSTPEPEELSEFSPDGKFVAFVRNFDLYVVDTTTGTERRLTTDGTDLIRNGKNDWVYFEEIFNRNWKSYWWSPDSTRVAFYRTDASMVPEYTLVDDLPQKQRVERVRYPRVGEANPQVKLGVVRVAGGTPVFVDLSDYDPQNMLISGVAWWPDSSSVFAGIQNRYQTWMDCVAVSPNGGKPARLFRETTQAWVEFLADPAFLSDGSFLWQSERSGWRHLYHYAKDGTLKGPVTTGEFEVRSVVKVDEMNNVVFFNGTKDSHIASNFYRTPLSPAGTPSRLTTEPGSHSTSLNPGGTLFVDTWSSFDTPSKIALRSAADGSLVRTLDTNPVYAIEEFKLGKSELVQIPAADGFVLEGLLVYPPDFDPAKKYPVWITTYAGPHAPTVSDSWGGGHIGSHVYAHDGMIMFGVDPRSASGKGAVSAWACYKQLGVSELKDLEDAVRWVTSKPFVDGSRVGISGYSYGGFIGCYALTHSTLFSAAISGGPPTDWREYDSIYTERYMLTPQENPDGYDKTSVVKGAGNLVGKLMLVHGTIDDNVHPANSWKLAKALQDSGKQFEMAMYPGWRHGIGGRQYQRMNYEFMLRTMKLTEKSEEAAK
ncbi:MAG: DPP IV N-terminal domain-containing protein [Phycisphaerales bacterium]|nr:DPP IV N-terminal domain-containing protein [Phycisphaerales bacterium]